MITYLANQVKQPNQPQHQEKVVATLGKLNVGLEKSKTNTFTPAWLEILEEIDGVQFVGRNLTNEVKLII